jgi:hypothetical protein
MESIYLETSVVSYLAAPISRDLLTAAKQQVTQEWWNLSRHRYELYVSDLVEQEAARGDPAQAQQRLSLMHGVVRLSTNQDAENLAGEFLRRSSLPAHALADATHIALATVFAVDFLLTWNCRHIANPHILKKLTAIAASEGYELPMVCTPIVLQSAEEFP